MFMMWCRAEGGTEVEKLQRQLAAIMESKAAEINDDNIRLVNHLSDVRRSFLTMRFSALRWGIYIVIWAAGHCIAVTDRRQYCRAGQLSSGDCEDPEKERCCGQSCSGICLQENAVLDKYPVEITPHPKP